MNFVKLFNDYKVKYDVRVNKGWINVTCPFCDDKTFNGGFNNAGDYYHCWKCGGHNFKQALARTVNIPFNEVDTLIEQYAGRNSVLNALNKKQAKATKLTLPTDTFTPVERRYLKERNFSPKLLHEKYKIVGGGITGVWKYRIIIPLILNGEIVSWTARTILSKKIQQENKIPRYKNLSIEPSVYPPKDLYYNMDNCKEDKVIITEGAFDVIRLSDRIGNNDNVMCSWGTDITQAQISLLKGRFKKVFMLFDNEPLAQEKARKYGLQIASIGIDVEVVDVYSDFGVNDGADCDYEQVDIIRKELGI